MPSAKPFNSHFSRSSKFAHAFMIPASRRFRTVCIPFIARQPTQPNFSYHARRRAASVVAAVARSDDRDLREYFDQPLSRAATTQATGLFGDGRLSYPSAFKTLSREAIHHADALVQRIVHAPTQRAEMFHVVKNLDRISDILCSVIDLAELVRNAHPDDEWVGAASEAYEELCEYMNVLNTHVDLDQVLKLTLSDREITSTFSEEALATAKIFSRDFDRSGVHLPLEKREKFVSLSSRIIGLGNAFLQGVAASNPSVQLQALELTGFPGNSSWRRKMTVKGGSAEAHAILALAPLESTRRKVFEASHSGSNQQVGLLDDLLSSRAELAKLVGFPSYAAMELDDKMAKTPENVVQFLSSLATHMRPLADQAIENIRAKKRAHLKAPGECTVEAWDREYYLSSPAPSPPLPMPSQTVGAVFAALSRLFRHLYGITLRPADISIGEVWSSEVRKLEVVDEEQGILGYIYTDLYARGGQGHGAAHFTVRCSRLLDEEDLILSGNNSRVGHAVKLSDGIWQLPIVVLLCGFGRDGRRNPSGTIEWQEVQTLFHEMGHAIHSMVGRTQFHNVSGTRCATDFVELPSILMEHFLDSPQALAIFQPEVAKRQASSDSSKSRDSATLDTYSQIIHSMLDQCYHSPLALESGFHSSSVLAELEREHDIFPHVPGTSWQAQFGHLFSYGATYYSYLFDRAIASEVFRRLFEKDPLNRESGEKFKREILRRGGAKDPWQMVSSVLDAPELAGGGSEAMAEVGRWRVAKAGTAGQL